MTEKCAMKRYTVYRTRGGVVAEVDGRPLPLRLDLVNHSPTGFEYGYCGSGPAQLAIAMLADCLGDDVALACYQDFKAKCLAVRYSGRWSLTENDIRIWHEQCWKAQTS